MSAPTLTSIPVKIPPTTENFTFAVIRNQRIAQTFRTASSWFEHALKFPTESHAIIPGALRKGDRAPFGRNASLSFNGYCSTSVRALRDVPEWSAMFGALDRPALPEPIDVIISRWERALELRRADRDSREGGTEWSAAHAAFYALDPETDGFKAAQVWITAYVDTLV